MNETGIQKNIGNLATLLSYCKSYGGKYNPSNEDITIDALTKLQERLKSNLQTELGAKKKLQELTNSRAALFGELDELATQVMNGLRGSGADAAKVEDANAHNKKIQGTSAPKSKGKDGANSKEGETGGNEEPRTRSTSQQSFDNKTGHFEALIATLRTEPKYKPNEEKFSITGLEERLSKMNSLNENAKVAAADWSNALIARNEGFNDSKKGLVHLAQLIKAHVKYVFKASSQEYKHISKLQFVKIKER